MYINSVANSRYNYTYDFYNTIVKIRHIYQLYIPPGSALLVAVLTVTVFARDFDMVGDGSRGIKQ